MLFITIINICMFERLDKCFLSYAMSACLNEFIIIQFMPHFHYVWLNCTWRETWKWDQLFYFSERAAKSQVGLHCSVHYWIIVLNEYKISFSINYSLVFLVSPVVCSAMKFWSIFGRKNVFFILSWKKCFAHWLMWLSASFV